MARVSADRNDISGNPDAIAEAVAITKQMAQQRAASMPAKAKPDEPHFRGFFKTDETSEEFFNAEKHLEEHAAREAAKREAKAAETRREYRFFVRCREWPLHPQDMPTHALYFVSPPDGSHYGEVTDNQWFAGYKKPDAVWRNQIVCQVCLRMGREVPAPIEWVNSRRGVWKPDPRWVFQLATNIERATVEGEFRAFDITGAVNNLGRADAEARWQAHLAKTVNASAPKTEAVTNG